MCFWPTCTPSRDKNCSFKTAKVSFWINLGKVLVSYFCNPTHFSDCKTAHAHKKIAWQRFSIQIRLGCYSGTAFTRIGSTSQAFTLHENRGGHTVVTDLAKTAICLLGLLPKASKANRALLKHFIFARACH